MQIVRIPPTILLALGIVAAASTGGCKKGGPFGPPCLNAPPPEFIPPEELEREDQEESEESEDEPSETARRDVLERLSQALPPDVLARLRTEDR